MAQTASVPQQFRQVFKLADKQVLQWFPGHMDKGLKQMQTKLRSVDCIIEVHDARIPFSGRNSNFKYKISGVKPHILVLNKVDLIPKEYVEPIREKLRKDYEHVIFTDCKNQKCRGVAQVFPLAKDLINSTDRYNRASAEDYNIMMIGVPNVGKSSLVNALRVKHLRKGNASHVGAAPGITRSVLTRIKMCEKPLFYMLDTPGILTPTVESTDAGLKLGLCNTILEHLVGERILADFLLFWLNKHQYFNYVEYFGIEKPTDSVLEILSHICAKEKKYLKIRNEMNEYVLRPNFNIAASMMVRAFRDGHLGKYMLDENLL